MQFINATASENRPIGFYNYSVNLSNKVFSNLVLCGAHWSNLTNITIMGSEVYQNGKFTIRYSDHCVVDNITSRYNYVGIHVGGTSNLIKNSVISDNQWRGISLTASPNLIYNNLFNNTDNFYISNTYTNHFNTTKQYTGDNIVNGVYMAGNYWGKPDGTGFSDTCQDNNKDGICDSPYELATNNTDYLPLKKLSFVRNSYINISSSTIWHRDKGLYETETINFKNALQQYLNNCQPDANGNCNVTLDIFSKTKGIMELYGLEILYYTKKPVKALVESFSPKDIYVTHLYIIGKDESKMCDLLNGSLTKIPRGGVAIIKGECNLLCEQIHRIILSGPCGISDSIDPWGVRDVCKS